MTAGDQAHMWKFTVVRPHKYHYKSVIKKKDTDPLKSLLMPKSSILNMMAVLQMSIILLCFFIVSMCPFLSLCIHAGVRMSLHDIEVGISVIN